MDKLPESEFLMLLKVSMKPIGAEVCVVLKSHNILENIIDFLIILCSLFSLKPVKDFENLILLILLRY